MVAHLASLRGFSLKEIDEMLAHRASASAPTSPRIKEADQVQLLYLGASAARGQLLLNAKRERC